MADTVDVYYSAPVVVTVDVERKLVTRVVVLDEEVQLDRPAKAAAMRVAEEADWPPWEIGP